ncbi:MAG: amidase [Alphaproteobacteria bacterium]|nr:amidase [Alphaproteobacteria bacterium]
MVPLEDMAYKPVMTRSAKPDEARTVAECRARIAERDGAIGAFVRLAPEAPDMAPAIAVKDIIDTAGLGTEYGSPICRGHVPQEDADCVARLKRAGYAVIGKTVTTEFAHVTPQATRNPRDPRRSPGGSSSGSAAAVAAGMVPLALGTQTGGSVIRPASYCGVFGFKSSIGRTDTAGVHELARSLDTVGWFARGAEDLAALGPVLLCDFKATKIGRPRLAWARTPYDSLATPEALAAVERAGRILGADAISLPADFGALNALHQRIVSTEAARAFARYPESGLSPKLREFVALGRANEPGYAEAQELTSAFRARFDDLMTRYDALILPAATGEAPLGLESTGDASFSLYLSLLGPPCISIPCGQGPAGMPIGVQLVGRRGRDEVPLALAREVAPLLMDQK